VEVNKLVPFASIVISEDSTAALDAMINGKPLIHSHFATSQPTMPFVDYGAALPGYCKEGLIESILRIIAFNDTEAQVFLAGQIDFLRDYAGPCDGNATNRFVDFVGKIICNH